MIDKNYIADKYKMNVKAVENFLRKNKDLSDEEIISHYEKYTASRDKVNSLNDFIEYICKAYELKRCTVVEYIRENPEETKENIEKHFLYFYKKKKFREKAIELGISPNKYRRIYEKNPDMTPEELEDKIKYLNSIDELDENEIPEITTFEAFKKVCLKKGINTDCANDFRNNHKDMSYNEVINYYINKMNSETLKNKLKRNNISNMMYYSAKRKNPDMSEDEIINACVERKNNISIRQLVISKGLNYGSFKEWKRTNKEVLEGLSDEETLEKFKHWNTKVKKTRRTTAELDKLDPNRKIYSHINTLKSFIKKYHLEDISEKDAEKMFEIYKKSKITLSSLCKKYGLDYKEILKYKQKNKTTNNQAVAAFVKNLAVDENGNLFTLD